MQICHRCQPPNIPELYGRKFGWFHAHYWRERLADNATKPESEWTMGTIRKHPVIHALRQECIRRDIRIQHCHTDSESEDGPYDVVDEDERKGKVDSKGDNHKKGDGKGKMTGGIANGKGKGKGKDTGIVKSIQKKGGHRGQEKGKGKGKQGDGKGEGSLKGGKDKGKDKGKGHKEGKGKDKNDKGKTAQEAREKLWKEVGAVKLSAREAAVLAKAEEVTKEKLEKEQATYGKRKGKGNGKGKAKGDDADEALGKADKADDKSCKDDAVSEEDDAGTGKGKGGPSPSAKRNVPRGTADARLRSKRLPVSGIIDDGVDHQDGLDDDEDGDSDDVAKEPDDSQPASGPPHVLRATARHCVPQWLLPPPPMRRATAKCNDVALLPVRAKRGRDWK